MCTYQARLRQQHEPAVERRQQLDMIDEHGPRVRVEGDDRRAKPRYAGRLEHAPVPAVDAVEGPDCDRALGSLELGDAPNDPHAATPSRASASSGETSRSGSASWTPNGPTSVRRHAAKW